MTPQTRILIIGGGIAGLSVASELCRRGRTGMGLTLVEAEPRLAHHTSSRSAQHLSPGYGPPAVRELTRLTVAQLRDGLPGASGPVVWPAPTVVIGSDDQLAAETTFTSEQIDRARVLELCPELSRMPEQALQGGLFEDDAVRTDAPAILEWHRSQAAEAGTRILTDSPVRSASYDDGVWTVLAGDHRLNAEIVINAAGAWADKVAGLFGASTLGLQPLRRTAAVVELERPLEPGHPVVVTADGGWYYRADPEGAMISTGEAEPEEPCDSVPHPGQIEALVDELNSTTDLRITGVKRAWTGQRTAAPDGVPVCGFNPRVPGFLWLAGQSGYGFQTSTALARAAADCLLDGCIGAWCSPETTEALSPARF